MIKICSAILLIVTVDKNPSHQQLHDRTQVLTEWEQGVAVTASTAISDKTSSAIPAATSSTILVWPAFVPVLQEPAN